MTNEEYFAYMDSPLSQYEQQMLTDKGWAFGAPDYIYLPEDYDGCFASGIRSIRRILLAMQHTKRYNALFGRCKELLEEIQEVAHE